MDLQEELEGAEVVVDMVRDKDPGMDQDTDMVRDKDRDRDQGMVPDMADKDKDDDPENILGRDILPDNYLNNKRRKLSKWMQMYIDSRLTDFEHLKVAAVYQIIAAGCWQAPAALLPVVAGLLPVAAVSVQTAGLIR